MTIGDGHAYLVLASANVKRQLCTRATRVSLMPDMLLFLASRTCHGWWPFFFPPPGGRASISQPMHNMSSPPSRPLL